MAHTCSEPGCGKPAAARGLCTMHYQRLRRSEGQTAGQLGRPKTYPEGVGDKHGGAPRVSVRLDPDVYEWVKSQGGGAWLRHISRELCRLAEDPGFEPWWRQLALPETQQGEPY